MVPADDMHVAAERSRTRIANQPNERPAMSFRDNLQHLRATRNMTQEQLAMLVGVSRQSVTKWESERAYPEMDKLLKLCQIFDCSLDDLVSGDLTARPADASAPEVPAGPPTDVCGYDEQGRRFALRVSLGVGAFVLGIALAALTDWLVSGGNGTSGLASAISVDSLSAVPLLVCSVVGLVLVIPAGLDRAAFRRAHPYVEDFYTEEDHTRARSTFSRSLVLGVGLCILGTLPSALAEKGAAEDLAGAVTMLVWSVGVWLIMYGTLMYGRLNVAGYNQKSLSGIGEDDIDGSGLTADQKERLLAYRQGPRGRNAKLAGQVSGIIMLASTAIALLMLFGGLAAGWHVGSFFWIPWPIGGLLCAIAGVVIDMRGEK